MKRVILFLICAAIASYAQNSDTRIPLGNGYIPLTSTCANANSTCDTAGVTNFGQNGAVMGPQTLEFNTQGYGLAVIYVSGTSTAVGSTISFEFSDDGGTSWYLNTCTRTDASIQETGEAVPSATYRAFDCGVGAATRMRVRQTAISSGTLFVSATLTTGLVEPAPTTAQAGMSYSAITTSTNTQIKSTAGFIHTITITQPGATATSITIVDTTAANCSGGTTIATIPTAQLTAGMAPTTVTLDLATNNGICVTTAGTTSPQLVVTWK